MIQFEFRKIFTQKYITLFLAALLCVYCLLFSYTVSAHGEYHMPKQAMDALFMEYYLNPDDVEEYYAQRQAKQEEYREITRKMTLSEVEAYGKLELPNRYVQTEHFDDDSAYQLLYAQQRLVREHGATLQAIISEAQHNLQKYDREGMAKESYAYRYQLRLVDTYTEVLTEAPQIGFEYPSGWDLLFFSETMDLFIILGVILFSSVLMSQERSGGMLCILRTTRGGRGRCVAAKLGCAALLCAANVAIYAAVTALMIGTRIGFSNGLNYIQSLEALRYAPVALRMVEYLALMLLSKLLVCMTVSVGVMLLSLIARSHAVTYVGSVALYASGYAVAAVWPSSLPYLLSPIRVMRPETVWKQAQYIRFLGYPISHMQAIVAVYALLLLVGLLAIWRVYGVMDVRIAPRRICAERTERQGWRLRLAGNGAKLRPLLLHEGYKRMVSSRMALLALALIVLQLATAYDYYAPYTTQSEQYYVEYLHAVQQRDREDAHHYLSEEGERITRGLENADKATALYREGAIDEATYHAVMNEYFYAVQHAAAHQKITEQLQYADTVKEELGITVKLINPRAWTQFFDDTLIYPLLIWCVTLAAGIVPFEYQARGQAGGFAPILRTTKRGRRQTFWAKLWTVVALSSVGCALHGGINLSVFSMKYGVTELDAPLLSLPSFGAIHSPITIGAYLLRFYLGCLCAVIITAVTVYAISELTHHLLLTLCVSTGVLFLPLIMSTSGISFAQYLNLLAYLRVSPMYLLSAEKFWLSADVTLLLVLYAAMALLTLVLMLAAYQKCKRNTIFSICNLRKIKT